MWVFFPHPRFGSFHRTSAAQEVFCCVCLHFNRTFLFVAAFQLITLFVYIAMVLELTEQKQLLCTGLGNKTLV